MRFDLSAAYIADSFITRPRATLMITASDFIWANFAQAGSGIVTFTETDENVFNTGDGYVDDGFDLVDTPDECN